MKKNEKSRRRSATAGKVAYGVFVLSLSGILVKVIGLLFKIPLTNMIGESGMGYFNSAYTVYSFFYILSTAGLPIALSIMISSSRQKQIQKRVFNTALALFALMGVLLSCLMLLGAGLLSDFISNPDAVYSIMTMAPCLLFVCIASAYRGYFQGCQSMLQTALSQLIEAAGKLILGMLLALWAIRRGFSSPIVAAFAVLGITLGSGISMLYLVVARRFFRGDALDANESEGEENTKVRTILKKLIKLSVPITASSAVLSLSGLLDLAVVMRRLQQTGYSAELANALYGNYTSLAVPLFNMPAVLITPISCALVPYIAKAISTGERKKAISGAQNCLKYATIIGIASSVGLSVLSEPILRLIFSDTLAKSAAPLLSILAISVIFVAYTNVTVSIMQSSGFMLLPIASMATGGVIKLVGAWFFVGNFGIAGAPMSTLLCYLTMSVINFALLDSKLNIRINIARMIFIPLVASLCCALSASFTYIVLEGKMHSAACLPAIVIGGAVYLALLFVFGYIKKEELQRLPIVRKFAGKAE